MRTVLAIAASLLMTGAALASFPADAFRAVNGSWVLPKTARTFYVPWRGTVDSAFFCAAADYARNRLGMSGSTPIFRLSAPPRKAGEGLWFSLDPEGAASRSGVLVFFGSGPENSFSVNSGLTFCDPSLYR